MIMFCCRMEIDMNFRKLIFAFACIFTGILIGIVGIQKSWLNKIYEHFPVLISFFIIGLILLALASWFGYLILKLWIKHKLNINSDLTDEEVVIGVADSLTNRQQIDFPDTQDRMHSLMVSLGLYYVRSAALQRYFLVIGGSFTALIGVATMFLLYEQNRKLDFQTKQIEIQNEKIGIQTKQISIQSQANTVASLLMEGARRATKSSEQTALFAEIRDEVQAIRKLDGDKAARVCWDPSGKVAPPPLRACWREVSLKNGTKLELVHLSENLFQRARAFAVRAKPYPIAKKKNSDKINIEVPLGAQYEFQELSPERGQLLKMLVLNKVDVNFITFEKAQLEGADLSNAYLVALDRRSIDLRGANLSDTYLSGANLTGAWLPEANFRKANLRHANLDSANLGLANLTEADLIHANLREANLAEANLEGAYLGWADLTGADLTTANLNDIDGMSVEAEERKSLLNLFLRPLLAPSRALDAAILPNWLKVSCHTSPMKIGYNNKGGICPVDSGWTISFEEKTEFEQNVDGERVVD